MKLIRFGFGYQREFMCLSVTALVTVWKRKMFPGSDQTWFPNSSNGRAIFWYTGDPWFESWAWKHFSHQNTEYVYSRLIPWLAS